MERTLYQTLLDWKKNEADSCALLIDGARRVGKSWLAEQFAKREYDAYAMIDFGKASPKIKQLFDDYLDDLDTFFLYLQQRLGTTLPPKRSLVVFDEVQRFPRAREAIKHLVADGRYHYLETGSLVSLRKNVRDIVIPSEERHVSLYPMDFREFLSATGNDAAWPLLENRFRLRKPLGETSHRQMMALFRQYLVVGGMPQAVSEFIATHDLVRVDRVKRRILELYRADIRKYAGRLVYKVEGLFDDIPAQLGQHEKKFRPSALKPGAKMRDFEDAFLWLMDAMIVNVCFRASEPSLGLKMNLKSGTRKCYLADTGLLVSHAFDANALAAGEIHRKLLLDELDVNEGMIVENIVAQMLAASGHRLYFFSKSDREHSENRMEIDFLFSTLGTGPKTFVSPLEVKSGRRFSTISLDKFRKKYARFLGPAYVLHPGDLKCSGDVLHLPLYMAPLLFANSGDRAVSGRNAM